ncbi:MAG TPA: mandelate racemase/muconate lactonizing enzyme family protein [Thermomicrobiales bacterium]|nr:mandelate racemase/muconate lactonizing enzyme family protein [Thermomicrobiales bacterium]
MKIDAVDLFYLSMPEVLDIGDGSQDLLLVRIVAGEYIGWGECEASPLVSIASFVTPMSHSACKPVRDSVLGQPVDSVGDIRRIGDRVRTNSLDLLQADHTLSGIDMALWDVLGKLHQVPVYTLLGSPIAHPKRPYASQLFGDTAAETFDLARQVRQDGYTAAKFGWGPFGLGEVADDVEQMSAAREGLGPDAALMVDVGTVWADDVARAAERLDVLKRCDVTWLEEPFVTGAFDAYRTLAVQARPVALAAGEGCHNTWQARHLIDYASIGFVQIDAGRIGGITPAADVARYAEARGVAYVNHTFTSHLALSASLQPFAGMANDEICEYPVTPKSLALDLTREHLDRDRNGMIHVPDRPGLGMSVDIDAIRPYLVDVDIRVNGQSLYRTPDLVDS